MEFRSKDPQLTKQYNKRKLNVINKSPSPVSDLCSKCWYQGACYINILKKEPPTTCFIYDLFTETASNSETLETIVEKVCGDKCKDRQKWLGDPVPHNARYCEDHCVISRYILDLPASKEEDVPRIGDL
jgi:hypothetical protein